VRDLRDLTAGNELRELIATDLEYASLTLDGVMNADIKMDERTSRDVVETYDNMLGVNMDILVKSQQGFNSMERYV
jgi:hypothetical protein